MLRVPMIATATIAMLILSGASAASPAKGPKPLTVAVVAAQTGYQIVSSTPVVDFVDGTGVAHPASGQTYSGANGELVAVYKVTGLASPVAWKSLGRLATLVTMDSDYDVQVTETCTGKVVASGEGLDASGARWVWSEGLSNTGKGTAVVVECRAPATADTGLSQVNRCAKKLSVKLVKPPRCCNMAKRTLPSWYGTPADPGMF